MHDRFDKLRTGMVGVAHPTGAIESEKTDNIYNRLACRQYKINTKFLS